MPAQVQTGRVAALLLLSATPAAAIAVGSLDSQSFPSAVQQQLLAWVNNGEKFDTLEENEITDQKMIQSPNVSNCSSPLGFEGFQFTHYGHFTHEFKNGLKSSVTECKENCWAVMGCNGFSYETEAPHRCFTYKGPMPIYHRAARTYRKCAKFERRPPAGEEHLLCPHSDGITDFKFSHQGWLPNPVPQDSTKTPKRCSRTCMNYQEGECVAFTWRKGYKGNNYTNECFVYVGRVPVKAPAVSYARCFAKA